MHTCYFVRSVTLVAKAQMQPITTVATGRALIFVDADGRVSGVIEAPAVSRSAASLESDDVHKGETSASPALRFKTETHFRWRRGSRER